MEADITELQEKARQAKAASKKLAFIPTKVKNDALLAIAQALLDKEDVILHNNEKDYKEAEASGMSAAMLDRLMLDSSRIKGIAADVKTVVSLPDPVGEVIEERKLPNGLLLSKRRVPLGVIGAIYESRPNVTVDISVLCLKAGNSVILRGGKEAYRSNLALAGTVQEAAYKSGLPAGCVQFIESTDRNLVDHMLKMKQYIDLIIPRGGENLIKFVRDNAAMAVVAGGIGVCHQYVDKTADLKKATAIAYNAKVQRPTVCNALDCLLVHKDIAADFLPMVAQEWAKAGVEMRCDQFSLDILKAVPGLKLKPATAEDWGKEFLALIGAIKVVDSLDEALAHIDRYGSGHSEAIISEDKNSIERFLNEIDAACVYANASTRFTDGAQFGMGAEIGISTQKFHARGPMALREISSYKWCIVGSGQVRP
ncbi:MAG: glutamate-5-semialdehyde dehydrogenase [Dehalococcoidia bacterium]|nr:glutamate-5-semialdehyde dehydrogenase [Dehalococcoidia bacterium]MDD5494486.1 glutamate-5-semialdehyde dehydrogenase [Dehalococcoidia bacterium]